MYLLIELTSEISEARLKFALEMIALVYIQNLGLLPLRTYLLIELASEIWRIVTSICW